MPRDAAPVEQRHAAPAGLPRIAAGHHRLQAARVDGIDRHVRAHGRVDGRAQLHLVVLAVALHPGAEIDDRFALLNRTERFGQRFQRAKPDVVVEQIELGRIGGRRFVCCRGRFRFIGCDCARGGIGGGCSIRRGEPVQRACDFFLIVGEIRQHVQHRAHGRDGHQIRGAHLFVDIFAGGIDGVLHVFGLH